MMDKVERLINILLDNTARENERDDAAMDLGMFNDDRALAALLQVASNPHENKMILDSCGVSIGEILIKKEQYDLAVLDQLAPIAKEAAYFFIEEAKSEWPLPVIPPHLE